MRFTRWTFTLSGIVGLIILLPLYFSESKIAITQPPAITHPEYFYGFTGVAVVFQLIFLLIGRDPVRWRTLIPLSILEKVSFVGAIIALSMAHRVGQQMQLAAALDGTWMLLFIVSWWTTATRSR